MVWLYRLPMPVWRKEGILLVQIFPLAFAAPRGGGGVSTQWSEVIRVTDPEPDPNWIRLRIQIGSGYGSGTGSELDRDPKDKNDPQKWEKIKKFHVLKCWKFSF